jgi:hypothetical protein
MTCQEKLRTSAGTMGAFTAVAASSPFRAPTTASAISMATPSCNFGEFSSEVSSAWDPVIQRLVGYDNAGLGKDADLGLHSTCSKVGCYSHVLMQYQLAVFRWRFHGEDIKSRLLPIGKEALAFRKFD